MKTDLTLFTDTGGILVLDPNCVSVLLGDALYDLNVVLDPDGRTDQAGGFDSGQWAAVWSQAASRLRRVASGGSFVLVLSGEGTFHLRVQDEDLTAQERARIVKESTDVLNVDTGALAVTDGMVLFEGEATIPGDRAEFVSVVTGAYQIQVIELALPSTLPGTVGVHGSPEYPALVFLLRPSEPSRVGRDRDNESFHRLERPQRGHQVYEPGWSCYAVVARISGDLALLNLMLTASISSGHGEVPIPEGTTVNVGDFVLVNLVSQDQGRWKCRWVAQCDAT